ncbi:MAG: hypothetical protein Aurels2KO_57840 [Aureliella sp.]
MVKSDGDVNTNIFNLEEYIPKDGEVIDSFFGGEAIFGVGVGYAVVLGFGLFFSIFTTIVVFVDYKFGGTVATSEQFNTAGRSIKTGLTASVIVSQWTWAATLLQVNWASGRRGCFFRCLLFITLIGTACADLDSHTTLSQKDQHTSE